MARLYVERFDTSGSEVSGRGAALGPALRRAWIGYQRRLDAALAAAGFADRRLPDGRVLRLCRADPPISISQIGRELGITRQGAAKLVRGLSERGHLMITTSPSSAREKVVSLTPKGQDYLAALTVAIREIEQEFRKSLGAETYTTLEHALDFIGGSEDMRLLDYFREKGTSDA